MTDATSNQQLLIGIDDTDNLESRGTGYQARSLGAAITENGWGSCRVITRHQLLKSPLVPFTSHNSAACVRVQSDASQLEAITDFCLEYLEKNSAEGSDAGLCIAWERSIPLDIYRFGFLCKQQLVSQNQAWALAETHQINLYGLTGDKDGVIGALAAVGLQASGSDGRMLWLANMREQAEKTVKLGHLINRTGIDLVQSIEGQVLTDIDLDITMGPWPRAIWLGGKATLIVEPDGEKAYGWQVAAKDYLRQF
jgi:hypothetical protein